MFQAGSTIGQYLCQAIRSIDDRLGEGYAEDHPELIVECIRSQTMDFNMTALSAVLYEISDALKNLRPYDHLQCDDNPERSWVEA